MHNAWLLPHGCLNLLAGPLACLRKSHQLVSRKRNTQPPRHQPGFRHPSAHTLHTARMQSLHRQAARSKLSLSHGATRLPALHSLLPVRHARRGPALLNALPMEVATVAAAEGLRALLQPQADTFNALNLPEALVHWGHPGNMAVVLGAMGFYGAGYLGWQIRTTSDSAMLAKAKDLHPKLAAGMFFFFAAGAGGGILSMIMQNKPILESPHAISGLAGLGLLTVQAILPALFNGNNDLRTAHAFLGTGILGLFVVHAALGLQLGLSLSSVV